MSIRILIADDHGVLRAGLHALLETESNLEVVGEAVDGDEALKLALTLEPDVVLMDISMAGSGGIQATRKLKEHVPNIKVLILTVHEDKELLQEAIRAGASGYILKRAVKSELINAIQAAARGEMYVHPALTRALFTSTSVENKGSRSENDTLSKRETEVITLIVKGHTNTQIAEVLNISIRTVEFHRRNIMNKLNVDSRVGLVRYAAEHNLL